MTILIAVAMFLYLEWECERFEDGHVGPVITLVACVGMCAAVAWTALGLLVSERGSEWES